MPEFVFEVHAKSNDSGRANCSGLSWLLLLPQSLPRSSHAIPPQWLTFGVRLLDRMIQQPLGNIDAAGPTWSECALAALCLIAATTYIVRYCNRFDVIALICFMLSGVFALLAVGSEPGPFEMALRDFQPYCSASWLAAAILPSRRASLLRKAQIRSV